MPEDVRITLPVAKILAAFLAEPERHRYGLQLMAEADLASGTLYPILTRLTKAGWVESQWEDIDPATEGRPPRRYYLLTAEGAARAQHAMDFLPRVKPADSGSRQAPARPAWGGASSTVAGVAW
ncbi:MAG: PadR family transcriptional regulator [Micromonosporaceae bacterium]